MKIIFPEAPNQSRIISTFLMILFLPFPFVFALPLRFERTQQPNANISKQVQSSSDVRKLEIGRPIEREMKGGESHTYEIDLQAGQFLNIVINQLGIEILVTVNGSDGKQWVEVDSPSSTKGTKPVKILAGASGIYTLNVTPLADEVKAGKYQVQIMEMRAATENDRLLMEASKQSKEVERLFSAGKYEAAHPLAERALVLREKVLGSDDPDVAKSLNDLAILHTYKGAYAKAEPLFQRSLVILEKLAAPDPDSITQTLINLGELYYYKGDFEKAESLYKRVFNWEEALGPYHLNIATAVNDLAALYVDKADYTKAEPLYQRALTSFERLFGSDHTNVATTLNNLAFLYYSKGDYTKGEPLHQRALTLREKILGPSHPDVANSLSNLALLYNDQGDYAKAEPLYQRALAVREEALGPNHPEVGLSCNNLGFLYSEIGNHAKAEPLLQRALTIFENSLGPDHARLGDPLANLGAIYRIQGDYTKAESLYQRALAVREKALGPRHPKVSLTYNSLAILYYKKGDYAKAIPLQTRANEISEQNIALNIATGSERQKLAYLATLARETDRTISIQVQNGSEKLGCRLAFNTVLRRKGRALDAVSDSIAALRRRLDPEDLALIDQLEQTRTRLGTLVLKGRPARTTLAAYLAETNQLEEQTEQLESQISRRSAEFRAQSRTVTTEGVQAALPYNSALVEFAYYHRLNATYEKSEDQYREARYVAYVLGNKGEVKWVDLGESRSIDPVITSFRAALRDPKRLDVKQLARAVDEKVMQPVRKLLGTAKRVFLSPDGALNLIPFASLVDENNHYLVRQYLFTYLTSGRDLLRLQDKIKNRQAMVIIDDPDYGPMNSLYTERGLRLSKPQAIAKKQVVEDALKVSSQATQAIDFSQVMFPPLPGTRQEGDALKAMMPEATVLSKTQATEAAVKRVTAPNILHIATHGFFLENLVSASSSDERALKVNGNRPNPPNTKLENPLLRSGLALAGANLHRTEGDDGILTALEVAGLDLWGTKLVVLSACETGVGEVRSGDGVYGLRRALVLAGSESQILSLWKVDDEATRDLMIGYYKSLKAGQGRSEALRLVQMELLTTKGRQHPYFWASFIQSGEWSNLEAK